jgi:hypothetical protein
MCGVNHKKIIHSSQLTKQFQHIKRRMFSTVQATKNKTAYVQYLHLKKDFWKAAFKRYLSNTKDPHCVL